MASKRIPTPSGLVQGENRNLSAIPTLIVLPWYHKYTLFVKRESCCRCGASCHAARQWPTRYIFFGDGDRRQYLACLRESAQREGVEVSAYCLMTNHVHLVVTPEREDSLARALGRTHLLYAQYVFHLVPTEDRGNENSPGNTAVTSW